jgi:hypothetical protein
MILLKYYKPHLLSEDELTAVSIQIDVAHQAQRIRSEKQPNIFNYTMKQNEDMMFISCNAYQMRIIPGVVKIVI